jgi:hypothetical protein
MPRKTDTVYQDPITAALLKSRKDSDVGLPFRLAKPDWSTVSNDSVSIATPLPYTSAATAGKSTGDANVDAIADVVRRKVGNLDVFLRSQGEKPEDYTQQELRELNDQLDDAIADCARGFAKDGWSAGDVEKYADKAWRADLGTTFFQKTLSNAVAYLPMSGAMLGVSFLLTPILGPLPTMVVGLGVGLYTAYKWSVHALNAAGKVDAKVNDEKEGRGRFWSVCASKGLWQALGKETLADLALRTGPRGAAKAVGGGLKIGLQVAGAAPGFTALLGGLILPAISAVIGPPTNGAMQVGSKMLHGRNGERSAAPLLGIKLEKKKEKENSEKTKARIYADHDARTRNVGRLAKSSARRFFSMAKKMAPEYRRSFADAYREEKKAGMKGKWRELIFGSNVLPGGGLGDVASLAGTAIGEIAGNVVSTFGNVATSVVTGPGNVLTRKEVGDRYKELVKKPVNKSKLKKVPQKVANQAPAATVDTPRDATVTARAQNRLSPSPVRTVADQPIARPDHQTLGARPSPAMRRLQAIASASTGDAAPTKRYVPAGFPNVPVVPPHLVSPSTERVVEVPTVIPQPVAQRVSDSAPSPSAVPASLLPGSMVETGWPPQAIAEDRLPRKMSLGAPPIGVPSEVPAQWFEPGNQTVALHSASCAAGTKHPLEIPVAPRVETPAVAATATDKRSTVRNDGVPSATSAFSRETIHGSHDAGSAQHTTGTSMHAPRKPELDPLELPQENKPHASDTLASGNAEDEAFPSLDVTERTRSTSTKRIRPLPLISLHDKRPERAVSHPTQQQKPLSTPHGISSRIPPTSQLWLQWR